MQLTKEEMAIVLDGLAALPLARSYNVFQKVLVEFRAMGEQPEVPMFVPEVPHQGMNGAATGQTDL